jgi:hypothetical protein
LDQAMEPSPVKLDEQPISDDATHGNDDGLRSEEEADTKKATTANSAVSVPARDVKNGRYHDKFRCSCCSSKMAFNQE